MKTLITVLSLILSYSYGFCQRQASLSLSIITDKIANIDAYVNEIDKNPKLFPISAFDTADFKEYSVYSNKSYVISNQTPLKTVKIVKINQNVNTTYFKNDHIVYMNEISSAHDNYSNVKNVYFQNDSIIYSTTKLCEEQVLQIQCSYDGAKQRGSYNLIITKDSIKYSGDRRKTAVKNSLSSWNKLKDSFNLADFDKVQTTGFRSYIDGHDCIVQRV